MKDYYNLNKIEILCPGCNRKRLASKYTKSRTGLCKSCSLKGKRNHRFISGPPKCEDCNKDLKCYLATKCLDCRFKYQREHPESNSAWIDGRSYEPYPLQFNEQLKAKIRNRDNYICQGESCNFTEEEHLILYGAVLSIHHINYNKYDLTETNLITTCKQCNARANFNRSYWQSYYINKILEGVK